jgi:hypothetical protein
VNYYLNGTFKATYTAPIACNGTFSLTFVPGKSLTDLGTGKVVTSDGAGRSAQASFTIVS